MDAASAKALAPWLDSTSELASAPVVEVEILAEGSASAPPVLEIVIEEPGGWLGRTASGLLVWNDEQAWFTVEGSPPKVRGILGSSEAAPELLLGALMAALRSLGVYGIHAAAVSFDDQALLLVGDSGAGKSTTATALVSAGCRYIGDDGCLIREHGDGVELLPLLSSFRLTADALASFSELAAHSSKSPRDEKWKVDVAGAFPDRYLSHWHGHKTLLFLERSGQQRSAWHPLSQADALGRLIAQSNALSLQCHPNPRAHLELLARLVKAGHVARLSLGTEWLDEPLTASKRLIRRARSFSSSAGVHPEVS